MMVFKRTLKFVLPSTQILVQVKPSILCFVQRSRPSSARTQKPLRNVVSRVLKLNRSFLWLSKNLPFLNRELSVLNTIWDRACLLDLDTILATKFVILEVRKLHKMFMMRGLIISMELLWGC